jgi:hypothetical protein
MLESNRPICTIAVGGHVDGQVLCGRPGANKIEHVFRVVDRRHNYYDPRNLLVDSNWETETYYLVVNSIDMLDVDWVYYFWVHESLWNGAGMPLENLAYDLPSFSAYVRRIPISPFLRP